MTQSTPTVYKPITPQRVRQQQSFSFSVQENFAPQDGSLRFELLSPTPAWVTIDPVTGVISGIAPATRYDKQFIIVVRASNAFGFVEQSFHLKVTLTDLVNTLALNLKKQLWRRSPKKTFKIVVPYRHEILEYIYEYFINSKFKEIFLNLIRLHAKKLKIPVNKDIHYRDFARVIKTLNPTVEKDLRRKLNNQHILLTAELKNVEFRNLYRQGSQPLGAHPVPVWGYLAAPARHIWSHVRTVLNAATFALYERQQNQKKHNQQQSNQRNSMYLYPRPTP